MLEYPEAPVAAKPDNHCQDCSATVGYRRRFIIDMAETHGYRYLDCKSAKISIESWRGTDWGSVVTWGDSDRGGDSSGVAAQLSSGVQSVVGNGGAFAAVKSDGSVVTWGDPDYGGDSSGVAAQLSSSV